MSINEIQGIHAPTMPNIIIVIEGVHALLRESHICHIPRLLLRTELAPLLYLIDLSFNIRLNYCRPQSSQLSFDSVFAGQIFHLIVGFLIEQLLEGGGGKEYKQLRCKGLKNSRELLIPFSFPVPFIPWNPTFYCPRRPCHSYQLPSLETLLCPPARHLTTHTHT